MHRRMIAFVFLVLFSTSALYAESKNQTETNIKDYQYYFNGLEEMVAEFDNLEKFDYNEFSKELTTKTKLLTGMNPDEDAFIDWATDQIVDEIETTQMMFDKFGHPEVIFDEQLTNVQRTLGVSSALKKYEVDLEKFVDSLRPKLGALTEEEYSLYLNLFDWDNGEPNPLMEYLIREKSELSDHHHFSYDIYYLVNFNRSKELYNEAIMDAVLDIFERRHDEPFPAKYQTKSENLIEFYYYGLLHHFGKLNDEELLKKLNKAAHKYNLEKDVFHGLNKVLFRIQDIQLYSNLEIPESTFPTEEEIKNNTVPEIDICEDEKLIKANLFNFYLFSRNIENLAHKEPINETLKKKNDELRSQLDYFDKYLKPQHDCLKQN